MRRRCPLIPTFVLTAAAAGLLVAGCGGGSSPPTSSATRDPASTIATDAVAFASCMHSHGLPSYPDPQVSQSGNQVQMKISPGGIDPNSPTFKAATHACGHLLPGGVAPKAVSPRAQAQDLLFASCMRTHGAPSFPDPDYDGAFTLPAGLDQQSQQFQRALTACSKVEPSSISILDQPPHSS